MWVVQTNHCQALEEPFQGDCGLWARKCAIANSTRNHVQCCHIPQALRRYLETLRLSAEIQHFNIRYSRCPGTQQYSSRAVQMCV